MPVFVRLLLLALSAGFALSGRAATEAPSPREPMAPLAMTTSLSGDAAADVPLAPLPLSVTLPVQAIQEDAPLPPLIDLTVTPDSLWQRIRNGFGMPDLHNPLVADRQSWYLNRPEMLQRILERSRRYLYHIVEELEKRGMPTELALLPMVESAFNPQAVSSARAMGIWQFIPATGRNYNLDQNWWVDERRDIIASTDAALTYLQNIYEMNGDWHLALASYNWGENAVARAMAKNEAKGLPTDYSSLTMPAETRYYVPKLQALKNIIAQPELFGFRLPNLPNQPYFDTVVKPPRMDVAVAARLAEIPIEEFVSLNPAYHRPVMNGNQAGPLVLPANKINTFLANLERYEAQDIPLTNWQTYQLKRGDTLEKVADKFQIDANRLRQINGITRRIKTGPGFNLLVPRPGGQANPDLIARALPQLPPEKEKAIAKAAKGGKPVRGGKPLLAANTAKSKPAAKSAGKPVAKSAAKPAPKKPAAKPQPHKKH